MEYRTCPREDISESRDILKIPQNFINSTGDVLKYGQGMW